MNRREFLKDSVGMALATAFIYGRRTHGADPPAFCVNTDDQVQPPPWLDVPGSFSLQ